MFVKIDFCNLYNWRTLALNYLVCARNGVVKLLDSHILVCKYELYTYIDAPFFCFQLI